MNLYIKRFFKKNLDSSKLITELLIEDSLWD
jgi:hypothetical protein